jgi:decaprenylphospho-beta-D-erythro-pentofuranosid-2-ulose 2-reductase
MAAPSWQHAIVVGASSGIGEAIARRLAAGGTAVALLARREAELRRVAAGIASAGGRAHVLPHDVTRADAVPPALAKATAALGGLDLLVYAAGIMPRLAPDAYDAGVDAAVVGANLIGAMAWVDAVVPGFVAAGRGTVVGVSSVAADRGRRGNPAYHASKAGLDAFLEAVRNRVARAGVHVVTVKPGPVDTPMSRGLARLPFLIGADDAARRILAAAVRGSGTAYVPPLWRPIMLALRNVPGWLFQRLDI